MRRLFPALLIFVITSPFAAAQRVIDIPTRPGVTQRFLLLTPESPKAAVILFAGGNGNIKIGNDGRPGKGGNFLVRTRQLFADQGMVTAVIDSPSDRDHLGGFRETPGHAADIKAVIAWLRENSKVPVWLVGTSRGTQSVGSVSTHLLEGGGPDGIVLTSTMLTDNRDRPVPEMKVDALKIPVLVVHHEEDGCRHCLYSDMPLLMNKLTGLQRKELVTFKGGYNEGNPCQAMAYHGFNGLEPEVVSRIAAWITAKP